MDQWRDEGCPDDSDVTKRLFESWLEEDHEVRGFDVPLRYWFCQREAIEPLAWLVEITDITDAQELIRAYAKVQKRDLVTDTLTQSSFQNLISAEARLFDPDTPDDVNEVINYVRAMNHSLGRLATLPVSVRLIREIHAELMRGVRGEHFTPGQLRNTQNWVGPPAAHWLRLHLCHLRLMRCRDRFKTWIAFSMHRMTYRSSSASGRRMHNSKPFTRFWTEAVVSGGC